MLSKDNFIKIFTCAGVAGVISLLFFFVDIRLGLTILFAMFCLCWSLMDKKDADGVDRQQ